jgi:hypothetical protein
MQTSQTESVYIWCDWNIIVNYENDGFVWR